jgi:hypothetical protein
MACTGQIPKAESRGARAFAGWCWFVHFVIAPVMFVVTLHTTALLQVLIRPLADGIPSGPEVAHKRLVLVTAPDTFLAHFAMLQASTRSEPSPERLLVMTTNRRDVHLTRVDERTVRIHEEGGFTRTGTELLFRDNHVPLRVGTKITMSDVVVMVTHETPDGVPDEAAFEFTKGLDEAYLFRKWEGTSVVAFSLPPIGTTTTFQGRLVGLP